MTSTKTKRASDEAIVDAVRDLEPRIADLMLMVRITNDIAEKSLNSPTTRTSDRLTFEMSKAERDAILFALSDVELRSKLIKDQYMRALDGEAAQ